MITGKRRGAKPSVSQRGIKPDAHHRGKGDGQSVNAEGAAQWRQDLAADRESPRS